MRTGAGSGEWAYEDWLDDSSAQETTVWLCSHCMNSPFPSAH